MNGIYLVTMVLCSLLPLVSLGLTNDIKTVYQTQVLGNKNWKYTNIDSAIEFVRRLLQYWNYCQWQD